LGLADLLGEMVKILLSLVMDYLTSPREEEGAGLIPVATLALLVEVEVLEQAELDELEQVGELLAKVMLAVLVKEEGHTLLLVAAVVLAVQELVETDIWLGIRHRKAGHIT
jgi:hypothetical protein